MKVINMIKRLNYLIALSNNLDGKNVDVRIAVKDFNDETKIYKIGHIDFVFGKSNISDCDKIIIYSEDFIK